MSEEFLERRPHSPTRTLFIVKISNAEKILCQCQLLWYFCGAGVDGLNHPKRVCLPRTACHIFKKIRFATFVHICALKRALVQAATTKTLQKYKECAQISDGSKSRAFRCYTQTPASATALRWIFRTVKVDMSVE